MNLRKLDRYYSVARTIAGDINRANRHVSLIFHRNALVSIGINSPFKTHTLARKHGYLFENCHSELDGFAKIRHMEYNRLTLVNYHFNPRLELKMARPCHICMGWCKTLFEEIIYSTPKGMVKE